MWLVSDVIERLTNILQLPRLERPEYVYPDVSSSNSDRLNFFANLGLCVPSMRDHMTDEGWQLFDGLAYHRKNGYILHGYGLPTIPDSMKVDEIISFYRDRNVRIDSVVLQDKREWDIPPGRRSFREKQSKWYNVDTLKKHKDIFKLTVLKDSHQQPNYHRDSAEEIDCHCWIIYYHPRIVSHLASYLRPEDCIRVYHSLNPYHVPSFNFKREGCIISGAVSDAYPLRKRLFRDTASLYKTTAYTHPGYHRNGCETPDYLKLLSRYKVAICTASRYGYALRKIIEATAVGCKVLTDLPHDDTMPEIDENLYRIHPETTTREISLIIKDLCNTYEPSRQMLLAQRAINYYNYQTSGDRLATDINRVRLSYNVTSKALSETY